LRASVEARVSSGIETKRSASDGGFRGETNGNTRTNGEVSCRTGLAPYIDMIDVVAGETEYHACRNTVNSAFDER
jgi:hypothetical protein